MSSQALSSMNSIIANKKVNQERDEFTIFGEHVAVKVRKLSSDRVKNIAQHKINSLIFEAEMG